MFLRALSATLLASLTLLSTAAASDISVPNGFNVETVPGAGPLFAVLDDGTQLLSTGFFTMDELSRLEPDGSLSLFATGFGSLSGLAQSSLSGDIVVGDSFGASALWLLRDLNMDGDALDAGENVPHPVQPPVLSGGFAPAPFDVAFRPGTDELFVSGSTLAGPPLGVVLRIAGGTASVYAEGFGFPGGIVFEGDSIYVADSNLVSRVVALTDGNADHDALDAGESTDFATGLPGAFDLVQAADDSFYLSGFGGVARLLPDGDDDGVSDGVDIGAISGPLAFTTTLTLLEGPGGFVPGANGEGTLVVVDSGFSGNHVVRSAPRARTEVLGQVANNSVFDVIVSGDPGALALAVVSLDPVGVRLPGVGDLCLGFDQPYALFGAQSLDGRDQARWTIVLHGLDELVGLPLEIQGVTLQGNALGLGNGLSFVVGS